MTQEQKEAVESAEWIEGELIAAAEEGPERNGLGTWLALAIAVLSGLATIGTSLDAGTIEQFPAIFGGVFAFAIVVGKYGQAFAKILRDAKPTLEMVSGWSGNALDTDPTNLDDETRVPEGSRLTPDEPTL